MERGENPMINHKKQGERGKNRGLKKNKKGRASMESLEKGTKQG